MQRGPFHSDKVVDYVLEESTGGQLTREEAYFSNAGVKVRDLPRGEGERLMHLYLPDRILVMDRRLEVAWAYEFEFEKRALTTVGQTDEAFAPLALLDISDWIGVEGRLFRTRRGEVSVQITSCELLAKSLRPLPFGKVEVDKEIEGVSFSEVWGRVFGG